MSKIIVRRQEYANNGTHANEIEAVVKDNMIVNTLSSAMDVAPSVGLLKSTTDALDTKFDKVWNVNFPSGESSKGTALVSWLNNNMTPTTPVYGAIGIKASNGVFFGCALAAIMNQNYGCIYVESYYGDLNGRYRLNGGTWSKI